MKQTEKYGEKLVRGHAEDSDVQDLSIEEVLASEEWGAGKSQGRTTERVNYKRLKVEEEVRAHVFLFTTRK